MESLEQAGPLKPHGGACDRLAGPGGAGLYHEIMKEDRTIMFWDAPAP